MNKSCAIALIQRQRRLWRSNDSDYAIARRGERVYRIAAVINIIIGAAEGLIAAFYKKPVFSVLASSILISGAILFWHSRRFTQAWELLADDARSDPHETA